MSAWRQLTRGLRTLIRRSAADQEIADEVQHYLDEAAAVHVARGLSPDQARRAARAELGSATVVEERVRDYGWERSVATTVSDVRFAGRMLRKSPVFTGVIVLVIALGSGAVTTIFSAMNALVLRPLPGVSERARLISLQPLQRSGTVLQQGSYSYYQYLRDRTHLLDGVGAWGRVPLTITVHGVGTAASGNLVSGNYFDVLGVRPWRGRFFAADEDRTPLAQPVIVLSHRFWKARLGEDFDAIGQAVVVNGHPYTVIGVAPADFLGLFTGLVPDAWLPLMMQPQLRPRSNLTNASWLWLFGRLRDGATVDAAGQEMAALAAAREAERGDPVSPNGFAGARLARLTGLPGGEDQMLLGFMSLLLGAAGLVLLIAGVNVAAMLTARAVSRGREMAVRAALGAGRGRLLRQLLTEVLVLFLLGALGGLALAVFATAALERLPLPVNVPLSLELSPDFRVFSFALLISLITGLVFGITPALQASRHDITSRLRDDSPGSGSRRTLLSRALIVGQLALSLLLLVAAGLFMRALARGQHVDPGFDVAAVATASFDVESWGYDETRGRAFYRALRGGLDGTPGITGVSYSGRLPLSAGSSVDDVDVGDASVSVHYATVDAGYFSVLQIPIIQGRALDSSDDERGAAVAVVNQALARRLWPDGGAIGRTLRFRNKPTTIVGIARDGKYATLSEDLPSFAYFPLAQVWQPAQALLVRTAADPERLGPAVQEAVLAIDPGLPRPTVTTLRSATAIVLLPQRVAAVVTGVLGAVGLLLASVGLYGLMAYSANRRTREIGIRVALGAPRASVLRLIVREGMRLAFLGIALGLVLAAGATRLLAGLLFNVSPLDGVTFAGMSVIFMLVASVATYLPARRAAAADPLTALRAE